MIDDDIGKKGIEYEELGKSRVARPPQPTFLPDSCRRSKKVPKSSAQSRKSSRFERFVKVGIRLWSKEDRQLKNLVLYTVAFVYFGNWSVSRSLTRSMSVVVVVAGTLRFGIWSPNLWLELLAHKV